jgi:hypothetical protein
VAKPDQKIDGKIRKRNILVGQPDPVTDVEFVLRDSAFPRIIAQN